MRYLFGILIAGAVVLYWLSQNDRASNGAVKVYSSRDINVQLYEISRRTSVEFRSTYDQRNTDITVDFRPLSRPDADAVSYAYRSHVDISPSAPRDNLTDILVHEFLHLAGEPHSGNPNSAIYSHSGSGGQLTQEQIERLRALAGASAVDRWRNQGRALGW